MAGIIFVTSQRGFDDDEFWKPRKFLEKAGVVTFIFSLDKTAVTSKKGEIILPNGHYKDILKEYLDWVDGVIFIGSGDIEKSFNDPNAHMVCREMLKRGKMIGASSNAINVLLNAGVLDGIRVACIDSEKEKVSKQAIVSDNPVESDGLVLTSKGVENVEEFGKKILEKYLEITGG